MSEPNSSPPEVDESVFADIASQAGRNVASDAAANPLQPSGFSWGLPKGMPVSPHGRKRGNSTAGSRTPRRGSRSATLPFLDGQNQKNQRLRHRVVVLRILISLLVVMCFHTCLFFSNGEWEPIAAATSLIVLCLFGLRGTFREDYVYLNIFWKGMYLWIFAFVIGMVFFLLAVKVESISKSRCQNQDFRSTYGNRMDICVQEVRKHLNIEAVGFSLFVSIALIMLTQQAKKLAGRLQEKAIEAREDRNQYAGDDSEYYSDESDYDESGSFYERGAGFGAGAGNLPAGIGAEVDRAIRAKGPKSE